MREQVERDDISYAPLQQLQTDQLRSDMREQVEGNDISYGPFWPFPQLSDAS